MQYSELSPIALFVYCRPLHTQAILDSLANNLLASKSVLYIFCDGPKEGASKEQILKIQEVRSIVRNESRFQKTVIIEHSSNKGLAESIVGGVTEVLNTYGTVIVLEDDLILSPYFLTYMNDSLKRYEGNQSVAQIGACNYFACGPKYQPFFFVPIPECLGWGTWKDRWSQFNFDASYLLNKLREENLIYKFNAYGSYNMESLLIDQISKKETSSWAIRWTAVCVLNNWLTLYPNPAMSNHVESAEATHANINILPPLCNELPVFEEVEVKEIPKVIKAMKRGYRGVGDYNGKLRMTTYSKVIFKSLIRDLSRLVKR